MTATRVHFADALYTNIDRKDAPVCVGFDPVIDRIPKEILAGIAQSEAIAKSSPSSWPPEMAAAAIQEFGTALIDIVAPIVPVMKLNLAFFEPFEAAGIRSFHALIEQAHAAALMVIADAKRADVGHSATAYAHAFLGAPRAPYSLKNAEAVTVNPYLGWEGVEPFAKSARANGGGLFVLVQTSNPSASEVQQLILADGSTVSEQIGRLVEKWANQADYLGTCGDSCIGAVVSPRHLETTIRLRALMPHCIFLVPGFGAQGRSAEEVSSCFRPDGRGAIVNASRSVIYAFEDPEYRTKFGDDWRSAIGQACADFVAQIRSIRFR